MRLGKKEKAIIKSMREGNYLTDYCGGGNGRSTASYVSVKGVGQISQQTFARLQEKKLLNQIPNPYGRRMSMTSYFELSVLGNTIEL